MDGTVPIVGKLLEDMADTCLGTDDGVTGNAQPLGQRISSLKANAVDVEGQPIGILLDAGNGLAPVGLVNPHSTSSPDPMGMEENHNLSDDLLCGPGVDHPLFALRTN